MPSVNSLRKVENVIVRTAKNWVSDSANVSKQLDISKKAETVPLKKVPSETSRAMAGVKLSKKMQSLYADTNLLAEKMECSPAEFSELLAKFDGIDSQGEILNKCLSRNRITPEQIEEYVSERCCGGSFSQAIDELVVESKEDFLVSFLKDLQTHNIISSNPVFEPYRLTLHETSEIARYLKEGATNCLSKKHTGNIYFDKITNLLRRKNPDLYEILGGDEIFTEQYFVKGSKAVSATPSRNILQTLQDNICGHSSLDNVINDAKEMKTLDFEINGANKSFLYSGFLRKSSNIPKIGPNNILELIKSNLITLDLVNSPNFKKIIDESPELKKLLNKRVVTYKNPELYVVNGDKLAAGHNFDYIVDKIGTQGFESLNSNEIHVLTDSLEDVFNELIKRNRVADVRVLVSELEPKARNIYSVIQGIKEEVQKTVGGAIDRETKLYMKDGLTVRDHFFMRMIDRDLANVTDNKTGRIIKTPEIVDMVVSATKDYGKAELSGVQGHGLKIITKNIDGKPCIETIML